MEEKYGQGKSTELLSLKAQFRELNCTGAVSLKVWLGIQLSMKKKIGFKYLSAIQT